MPRVEVEGLTINIFPLCFTPEMYVDRPELVETLVGFVRSRPAQPLDAFLAQTEAVLAHDASSVLRGIAAPTLVTYGGARPLCGALHEDPETFNRATLDFLLRCRP
jgi:pimeloyl-ACP methyl ester carboxylesterase